MIKSRLIEVLRTFSKKEIREFKKWLDSPIHNQRQDVISLYDYLLKDNNLINNASLSKKIAFNWIYSNEKFDDAKMRQVMHFMFKNVEEFLSYTYFTKDNLGKKISLAKVFRLRKLDRNFLKLKKDIEYSFGFSENQNEELAFKRYFFQKEIVEFNAKIKRTKGLNLQVLTDTFDEAYIAEKLKHGCLINSHKRVYKIDYKEGLLNEVLKYIQKNHLLDKPRIGIYFYLYKITSTEGSIDDFFILKNHMANIKDFPKTELREIYLLAINFCIAQMNAGNEKFSEETFNLYKNGIEKRIFIENNILSRWTFKNAIGIALRLRKFEWVEKFIENYNQYLEEKYKESYFNISISNYYFAKGEYKKAMELLNQYEHDDILINLNAKTILMKIYYELSEFSILESLLESMRAYIQRKKELGNQRRTQYKNIIRYTKKLLKVNPYSKSQKEKLKAEIEAAKPLTEKAWLLKQLEEL